MVLGLVLKIRNTFLGKGSPKTPETLFISAESADISSYVIRFTLRFTLSLVSKIASQKEGHQGWQESKHGSKCLGKEKHCRETTGVGLSTLRREVLHPASRTMEFNCRNFNLFPSEICCFRCCLWHYSQFCEDLAVVHGHESKRSFTF